MPVQPQSKQTITRSEFDGIVKQISFDECAALKESWQEAHRKGVAWSEFEDQFMDQAPKIISRIFDTVIERLGSVEVTD